MIRLLLTPLLLLMLVQPLSAALVAERITSLIGKADQPTDVAVAEDGRAYLLNGVNGQVEVFTPAGGVDFTIKPTGKGALNLPVGLTIGNKQLYIADSGNHRIAIFDLNGRFLRDIPLTGKLPPEPISILFEDDRLFWSDRKNHQVCRTDLKRENQTRCWGKRGREKGDFGYPFQMVLDEQGYLQVVDVLNARVQQFDRAGRFFIQLGGLGLSAGQLYRPNGLALSSSGQLLVSDAYFGTISLFYRGRFVGLLQDRSGQPLKFSTPVSLTIWQDQLYVVDTLKHRVEHYRLVDDGEQPSKRGKSTYEDSSCISCHLAWAKGYQAAERGLQQIPPVASLEMCYSCHHGVVFESRVDIGRGEQHPDIHFPLEEKPEQERKDKLPENFPLVAKELYCGSCHTPHNEEVEKAKMENNPWLRQLDNDGDLCEVCHESKLNDQPLQKVINHPIDIRLKKPPTEGAEGYAVDEALWQGLPNVLKEERIKLRSRDQLICESCHIVHGADAKALLPMDNSDSLFCERCHESKLNDQASRSLFNHPVGIRLKKPPTDGAEGYTVDQLLWQGLPKDLKEEGIRLGSKDQLICESCHIVHEADAEALLPMDNKDSDFCEACHQSKLNDQPSHSIVNHPVGIQLKKPPTEGAEGYAVDEVLWQGLPKELQNEGIRLGSKEQLICESCHITHGADAEALLPMDNKNSALCESCHQRHAANDIDEARRKGVHPVNIDLDEPVKVGDVEVKRITCLTCHSAHDGVEGTPSLLFDHRDGKLCSFCHDDYEALAKSDHDLRKTAKESKNRLGQLPEQSGLCGGCHTMHLGDAALPYLFADKNVPYEGEEHTTQRDLLCFSCHRKEGAAKDAMVQHFTHPLEDMVLRSPPEVMPLLQKDGKIGEYGEIACITCHNPHRWTADKDQAAPTEENSPGNISNSFLRVKTLKGTFCVECHGLETRAKYKYYHDKVVRDIGVDYLK